MKNVLRDSELGLAFINDLNPVVYTKKPVAEWPKEWGATQETKVGVEIHGLVAQEVREALDRADVEKFSGWREEKNGRQFIGEAAFVYPLIKAVNELTARVERLE